MFATDFDAALATFDLIADRPSSRGKNPPLPDVACYDAILEIAQKHSRADVTDRVVQGMEENLMASTAKADLMIKTYGESGKIDKAREVFENTLDEPAGQSPSLRSSVGNGKLTWTSRGPPQIS